jgi:hypothetical protein
MKLARISSAAAMFGVLMAHTLSAQATAYQGTVTNVTAYNGIVYVNVQSGNFGSGGQGSCPNGTGMVFTISVNPSASDFNKSMIALALSAKTTGLQVFAVGDGNCTNGNPYTGGGSEGLIELDLKG